MPYISKRLRSFHIADNTREHKKVTKRRERLMKTDPEAFQREIMNDLEQKRQAEEAAKYRGVMCKLRWGKDGPRENSGRLHSCGDMLKPIVRKLEFIEAQGVWWCPECGKEWDPIVPYFEKNYHLSFRQMAMAMMVMSQTKGTATAAMMAKAMNVSLPTGYRTLMKLKLGPLSLGWDEWIGREFPREEEAGLTNEDFQTPSP